MTGFDDYLKNIGRIPLLTPAEEITLGNCVRRWRDYEGGPDCAPARVKASGLRARDRLVTANLRLVVTISKKWYASASRSGLDPRDLVQEGSIGLQRAAERFDPAKGYKFSTYAHWWIRQAIGRAAPLLSNPIKLPEHALRDTRRGIISEFTRAAIAAQRITSLDAMVGDDLDTPLMSLVSTDTGNDDDFELIINRILLCLTPNERETIEAFYGFSGEPVYYAEIANRNGLARCTVAERANVARQKMRNQLAIMGITSYGACA